MRLIFALGAILTLLYSSEGAVALPNATTETRSSDLVAGALPSASHEMTPAELEDLKFYARQEGVPVEVMLRRFSGVTAFTSAVNDLRASAPSQFVYAEWGNGSGTIVMRPGSGATAAIAINTRGAHAIIQEADLLSEASRSALAERVGAKFGTGTSNGVLVEIDPRGGGVYVEFATPGFTTATIDPSWSAKPAMRRMEAACRSTLH